MSENEQARPSVAEFFQLVGRSASEAVARMRPAFDQLSDAMRQLPVRPGDGEGPE